MTRIIPPPPFPQPPVCKHPDKPSGKPLCQKCYDTFTPKVDAWLEEWERRRGIGHA